MLNFAVENKNKANEFKGDAEKVVESEERKNYFYFCLCSHLLI